MVRVDLRSDAVPRLVVCHPDPDVRKDLVNALRSVGVVEDAGTVTAALEFLAMAAADCLLIALPADRQGRSLVAQIVAAYPATRVVILAPDVSFETTRDLVRSGVADVLPLPLDPGECVAAVRAALADHRTVPEGLRGTSVAVVSGKGGSGCTVLAVHLAAVLAAKSAAVLVDADAPPFGTTGPAVDVDLSVSVAGLLRQRFAPDPRVLRQTAYPHRAGFSLLPLWVAPGEPEDVEEALEAALQALAAAYPFVILDIGRPVLPLQQALLRHVTIVVAVTTLDLLALRNLRHLFEMMPGGAPPLIVFNRRDAEDSYSVEEATSALGRGASAVLPHVPYLRRSVDRGEILRLSESPASWMGAVAALADELVSRRQAEVRHALR